ncbi:MAG: redoxin domain-containing protein [Planctomycetaceae bacterium]|nr:redoxin domain-containing protein [Planctomycetaceae bacterium]
MRNRSDSIQQFVSHKLRSSRPANALFVLVVVIFLTSAGLCQDNPAPDDNVPADPYPNAVPVPAGILEGGTEWLNTSGPLDLKQLRGKVVLLDFWTYCCINCMHVLPDLKYLEEKYEKQLVVIGVHSAKFDNEKVSQNIRNAILRYEIRHPVVNDSEMLIWRKFGTRAWPTLALIDPEGRFVGAQGGEGNRELFDAVIGKLVDYHRHKGTLDESPLVFDLEAGRTAATPLRYPGKVLADEDSGRLYISDSNHNRIVVTDLNGNLQTVIGSGRAGRADGSFSEAEFDHPQGMTLADGLLYVADTENHLLRIVDPEEQKVTTLAGTGKQGRPGPVQGNLLQTDLNSPWALCATDGLLFIAMAGPHQIWSHRIGSQVLQVHAGNAREDVINGPLKESSFAQPSGLSLNSDGTFFVVADSEGSAIRKVSVNPDGEVTTPAGTSELPRGQSLFAFGDVDAAGSNARFQHPLDVAWHKDTVYVADSYNHKIRTLDMTTGEVKTWKGTGQPGDPMDTTQFNEPAGLSIAGNTLFIADTNNHRICKADLESGEVSLLTIEGLTPPQPPTHRELPNFDSAVPITDQTVKTQPNVTVKVILRVPDGYKLNQLAPVTWEAFLIEGDMVLPAEATGGREEAQVTGDAAEFVLPLSNTTGKGTVAVEMSYGYCASEAGVCRLATALWKFPLTVSDDADSAEIRLAFPETTVREAPVPETTVP